MSEMIERMARAAYEQWNIGVESLEPSWDQCTEDFKFRLMEAQRFALKEIREPSDYYCVAIVNTLGCYPDKLHCDAVKRVHMAMIDQVLKND